MKSVRFREKEHAVPEVIEELTTEQYLQLLKLSYFQMSADMKRRRLMSMLLDLKADDYLIYKPDIIEELNSQLSVLDGFFDDQDQLRIGSCRQMLPEYCGWEGCGDMLGGMSFGQFISALFMLDEYKRLDDNQADADEKQECMNELTRQLYPVFDGSPVKTTDTPPILLTYHAASFFSAVYQHITTKPTLLNGHEYDLSIIFRASGGSHARNRTPDDKTGWQGIAFEIAEQGLFGTYNELMRQPLYDVLLYLYKQRFEQMHQKRQK